MEILRSQGLIKKKGTAVDLIRLLGGQRNIRVKDHSTGVDKAQESP